MTYIFCAGQYTNASLQIRQPQALEHSDDFIDLVPILRLFFSRLFATEHHQIGNWSSIIIKTKLFATGHHNH
jgi:hypothetical protein